MAKFIPWKAIKAKRERERGAASAVALDTEPVARHQPLAPQLSEPVPPPLVLNGAPAVHGAPALHEIARCLWCGKPFRRMGEEHWICSTDACADRQLAAAMRKAGQSSGPILFLPLPLQIEVGENTTTNLLVAGAAGVSKSVGCRWNLYKKCREIPGFRSLLIRRSYPELERNHLGHMAREAKLLGDATYKAQARVMVFHHDDDNDAMIQAGYCDDASDIQQHIGQEFDEVALEEGVQLLPLAISELSSRARGSATARLAYQRMGKRAGCTRIWSNPGGRAHRWIVSMFLKKAPDRDLYPQYRAEEYGFINCTLTSNPYLAPDYREKTLAGLSAPRYKQLAEGDWSVMAGQFFETFDPAIHLTTNEPE